MSGHRHVADPGRRRGRAAVAGCVALVAVATCVAVAALALRPDKKSPVTATSERTAGSENSPMNTLHGSERDSVPDACETLSGGLADKLVPSGDRSEMNHPGDSEQHSECAWSLFGSSRSRQLSVEMRAIPAGGDTSATDTAVRTFQSEWLSDRAGKDLADTAKVRDSRGVTGVGEQAYVVYTMDGTDRIGEAVANARLANVLITVHYSGGDDRTAAGHPLSSRASTDGALSAARDIISKLESHA